MVSEQETIDAITDMLVGEFYVGQRVYWRAADKFGTIVKFESGDYAVVNLGAYIPINLYLWALEPA